MSTTHEWKGFHSNLFTEMFRGLQKRAKHSNKSSTLSNHLLLVLGDGHFFEKGQSSPSFISRVQQET